MGTPPRPAPRALLPLRKWEPPPAGEGLFLPPRAKVGCPSPARMLPQDGDIRKGEAFSPPPQWGLRGLRPSGLLEGNS